MQKTSRRNSHKSEYDLYGDIAKIKALLAETTSDAKGRAAELIQQSLENARDRSDALQDQVNGYVSEKPIKSITLAMLAGLVIGYIIKK